MATPPPAADPEIVRARKCRLLVRSLASGPLGSADDGDRLVLSRETAGELLTPPRIEILDRLRGGPADSVRAVARELDRDKAGVSRDLASLAAVDLVSYRETGRAKRPQLAHGTVLVEPIV